LDVALDEQSLIPVSENIWKLIDIENTRIKSQPHHNLLLSMAVMYDVSKEILYYGTHERPIWGLKIVQDPKGHHENAIFSNIFTSEDFVGHPYVGPNGTVEKGTRIWAAPESSPPNMEELRETLIRYIELCYDSTPSAFNDIEWKWRPKFLDSINFNSEDSQGISPEQHQYLNMIAWIAELYSSLNDIMLGNKWYADSDYMRDEVDAFTKIWSQGIILGKTALRLNSTPGMLIALGLIASCGKKFKPFVHAGNIHVRYSESIDQFGSTGGSDQLVEDFFEQHEKVITQLIETLDAKGKQLGSKFAIDCRDLFPSEVLEKYKQKMDEKRKNVDYALVRSMSATDLQNSSGL
jgi:hypothetical protein